MSRVDDTMHQVVEHNARKNKMAIATVALFLCAVASVVALYITSGNVAALIAAIAFFAAAFVCAFRITDSSKKEDLAVMRFVTLPSCRAIDEGLREGEKLYGIDGNELDHDTDRCFVMSLDLNRKFTTLPLMCEIPEELYRFPEEVLSYTPYLKSSRDRELSQFIALRPDKVVMGLESDIDMQAFEDGAAPIKMHKVSRSAVQVTDDAFSKIIINKLKMHDKVVFDGRALCLDENGRLIPFSRSHSANEVDIHSLMISNDGYLMFRRGKDSHPLFPKLVVSSAACSLLPDECDLSRPIQESMIRSIHNKIHVIYDFPDTVDMKSSFVGFSRIIQRGGAPEFYCITRVDLTKDEIIACHRDETAEFMEDGLEEMVPRLDTVDNAALYIARAITSLREALPRDISLSTSALLLAVEDAFYDLTMAGKALRRIGLIEDEVADNPYRKDAKERDGAINEGSDKIAHAFVSGASEATSAGTSDEGEAGGAEARDSGEEIAYGDGYHGE